MIVVSKADAQMSLVGFSKRHTSDAEEFAVSGKNRPKQDSRARVNLQELQQLGGMPSG